MFDVSILLRLFRCSRDAVPGVVGGGVVLSFCIRLIGLSRHVGTDADGVLVFFLSGGCEPVGQLLQSADRALIAAVSPALTGVSAERN